MLRRRSRQWVDRWSRDEPHAKQCDRVDVGSMLDRQPLVHGAPHQRSFVALDREQVALHLGTASRPASLTIRIRPSVGRDGGGYRGDLGAAKTEIFLKMGLDR
jgi:hypothetical protein